MNVHQITDEGQTRSALLGGHMYNISVTLLGEVENRFPNLSDNPVNFFDVRLLVTEEVIQLWNNVATDCLKHLPRGKE